MIEYDLIEVPDIIRLALIAIELRFYIAFSHIMKINYFFLFDISITQTHIYAFTPCRKNSK